MKSRLTTIILILALLMISSYPVLAQDQDFTAEELEWIDFVAATYKNTLESDSYKVEAQQSIIQNITMSGVTIEQNIKQVVISEIKNTGEAPEMYAKTTMSITQTMNNQTMPATDMVIEMTFVEGVFYMRYSSPVPGAPEGWFEANDLFKDLGLEGIDFNTMISKAGGGNTFAVYPVSEETINTIKELDPEVVDGQDMRVFDLTWNLAALIESGDFAQMMDLSSLGIDMEAFWKQYAEGASMDQRMWIGAEDQLIYRVDVMMSVTGLEFSGLAGVQGTMTMDQEVAGTSTYSGYNEPVEIEKPVIGE